MKGFCFVRILRCGCLMGDEDSEVQIPLIREVPDYQRLCDRCVMGIVGYSLGSLERMQEVVGVLLDVRDGG